MTTDGSAEATSSALPPAPDTSLDRPRRRGSLLLVLLAVWLILVGVGALVLSGSFDDRPTVRLVGRDAPVNVSARSTDDISAHNSPTLARNPVRPGNLAVSSRIDTPFFSCGLHVSADGGATWTQTPVPAPEGEEPKCFAPDVAFSAGGTLYLSFVTLAGAGNVPHALWLSKSTDGGRTLSTPVKVHGELTFQARLAPDPAKPDRVFLTWLQAEEVGLLRISGTNNPITAARSDDGGDTWSTPAPVSGGTRERVVSPAPVVGRDGTLYVLYQDLGDDRLDYDGVHRGRGGPAVRRDLLARHGALARRPHGLARIGRRQRDQADLALPRLPAAGPVDRDRRRRAPLRRLPGRAPRRSGRAPLDARGRRIDVAGAQAGQRHPPPRRHRAVSAEARGRAGRAAGRPVLRPPRGRQERGEPGLAAVVVRRRQELHAGADACPARRSTRRSGSVARRGCPTSAAASRSSRAIAPRSASGPTPAPARRRRRSRTSRPP